MTNKMKFVRIKLYVEKKKIKKNSNAITPLEKEKELKYII